jgi:hypothetical protein
MHSNCALVGDEQGCGCAVLWISPKLILHDFAGDLNRLGEPKQADNYT